MIDANSVTIKAARVERLETYYGNAVSEHADRHLDLIGLINVLTLTPQKELNALASQRYRSQFGSRNVYYLSTKSEKDNTEQISRMTFSHNHHVLFSSETTFSKLASLVGKGAKIKQTNLSEHFDYAAYQ